MIQTIFDLPDAAPSVLAALPADILMRLQEQADAHAKHAAQIGSVLHATLSARYAAGINGTGTHRREDGGVEVTIIVPKRVKWDQEALNAAVETIVGWGENPGDFVEFEIKVSERKYDAWPPAIRDLFTPARTVEAGKPTFKLKPAEASS